MRPDWQLEKARLEEEARMRQLDLQPTHMLRHSIPISQSFVLREMEEMMIREAIRQSMLDASVDPLDQFISSLEDSVPNDDSNTGAS